MLQKSFPILLMTLGMLLQAPLASLRALDLGPAGLVSVSIPTGIAPVTQVTQADLDGDNTPETLALNGSRLSIFSGGKVVWRSPEVWQIIQAAITDLNLDGKPEVTLLLWRPFRPWPTDQWLPNGGRIAEFRDSKGQSCHIILIGWTRGGYHELWAGSAMADPIIYFAATDLNGNNTQELVTLEGRYTDLKAAPSRMLKVWEWNGFGFSVVSSMEGMFSKMTLVQANTGHILILVP